MPDESTPASSLQFAHDEDAGKREGRREGGKEGRREGGKEGREGTWPSADQVYVHVHAHEERLNVGVEVVQR